MSHVFHRTDAPITAVRAEGSWVYDDEGRAYLDASGGAIVVNIGHGFAMIKDAMGAPGTVDYVHPSVFTTEALEAYAADLADLVPVDDVRVFPTSGGAESVETAIKLARSYHLARGDADRDVVVSRRQSYHGNTLGALGISGRPSLREPYEPWLGGSFQVPEVYEYRCPNPEHPENCAGWHAAQLESKFKSIGSGRIAAFIGEAVGGATLAAAVPPKGYWETVAEVCERYGALLIVDEIMTGFGRTGRWFAIDEAEVTPDIIVSGKGAAGGYWPFGLCMASGKVHDAVVGGGGFVHGYTFSHSSLGAGVAHAVLREIRDSDLVSAAATKGRQLMDELKACLDGSEIVGEVRGQGLLIGIEFVDNRDTKSPFPRSAGVAGRVTRHARNSGLLVYPSTGCADGINGDSILLGPPFTITDEERGLIVERLTAAVARVVA